MHAYKSSHAEEDIQLGISFLTVCACRRWNARVLYGDTDSVFVLLKGRSLEAAFAIGREIADAVTRSNPPPIRLELEKVYSQLIM